MSKIGKSLLKGAMEALDHVKGKKTGAKVHKVRVPRHVHVREIRQKLHLTRSQFANRYGFNIRTLEKWEQGTREPDGAVRAYLVVIERDHAAVEAALAR